MTFATNMEPQNFWLKTEEVPQEDWKVQKRAPHFFHRIYMLKTPCNISAGESETNPQYNFKKNQTKNNFVK